MNTVKNCVPIAAIPRSSIMAKKKSAKTETPAQKKSGIITATGYELDCPLCGAHIKIKKISPELTCTKCRGKFLQGDVHHNHA